MKTTADRPETQNVTLALPKGVLTQVKVLAAERGTSISALLTGLLKEAVVRDAVYARARERGLAALEHQPFFPWFATAAAFAFTASASPR